MKVLQPKMSNSSNSAAGQEFTKFCKLEITILVKTRSQRQEENVMATRPFQWKW